MERVTVVNKTPRLSYGSSNRETGEGARLVQRVERVTREGGRGGINQRERVAEV